MQEKINALRSEILSAMESTESGRALYELKVKFQQELKTVMAGMKDLSKEEKPVFGKIVNEFKQSMEAAFEARAVVVKEKEMQQNSSPTSTSKPCSNTEFPSGLSIPA